MLGKLRPRLTYANLMATIAVFVALGGTSYAVATGSIDSREIKNNTIRSKDIRNNDVRGSDIRTGTIGSSDVGNGKLLAEDFKAGQLPAGPQGPQGAQGLKGDSGDPLARALKSETIAVQDNVVPDDAPVVVLDQNAFGRLDARCGDVDGTAGSEDAFLLIRWISPHASIMGMHQDTNETWVAAATASTLSQAFSDGYRFHVTLNGVHLIYEGFSALTDPQPQPQSQCRVFGVVRVVKP